MQGSLEFKCWFRVVYGDRASEKQCYIDGMFVLKSLIGVGIKVVPMTSCIFLLLSHHNLEE